MDTKSFDWKDVANSQFDKALALALVMVLFGIMVTPKVDVSKQKMEIQTLVAVDLPPEQKENIKPPEDISKPVVDIIISDVPAEGATDPTMVDMLNKQFTGIFDTTIKGPKSEGGNEKPFEFVKYEDPPEPINIVRPTYTDFARRMKIQGTVVLDVDVYRDGTVGNVTIRKSLIADLDQAAIDAVKKWKFQPGKSGGKAVDTTVTIPLEFTLTSN